MCIRDRKKAGLKRSGFSTPWREPKLFTIYLLDVSGGVERSFSPVHDATLGDADAMFSLLEEYLRRLGIAQAARVIFVGDGAPWIWERVSRLREALSPEGVEVFEVVDYYHAAAHLWKLVEVREPLSEKERNRLYAKAKRRLREGEVQDLKQEVLQGTRGKVRKQVLKGMEYFETYASRMQYAIFKAAGVPQGSGCVESAIRRVINLRLKAPGTFWTPKMAEVFLFLRAQVISGRWRVFLRNVATRVRHLWEASRRKRGYTETETPEKPLLTYAIESQATQCRHLMSPQVLRHTADTGYPNKERKS